MSSIEGIFLWYAIFIFAFSFAVHLIGILFKKDKMSSISNIILIIGFILLTGAVLTRWISTGHIPVMGTYENSLFGAWFVISMLVIFIRIFPKAKIFSLIVVPVTLLLLGNGIMAKAELAPLEPPYQSRWLYVHVLFAWFAFGSYLLSSVVSGFYLWKYGSENTIYKGRLYELLPSIDRLDDICLRLIIFGFVTDTVMIGAGAIWAHGLWGRYWGWDPVETWSLITWLIYGINLHLRLTLGWRGKKIAWLTLFSFLGVIITFFGIGLIGSVHTPIMKP